MSSTSLPTYSILPKHTLKAKSATTPTCSDKTQFSIIANRKSTPSLPSTSSYKLDLDKLPTYPPNNCIPSRNCKENQEIKPQHAASTEDIHEKESEEMEPTQFVITHPKLKTRIPRTEILKILQDDLLSEHSTTEDNIIKESSQVVEFPAESLKFLSVSPSSRAPPNPSPIDLTHHHISETESATRNMEEPRPSLDRQIMEASYKLKKQLVPLKTTNLSIVIDSYDFLFSDFDPRPYNEKLLSTDFLEELRRRVQRISRSQFELSIFVPLHRRDIAEEVLISERIQTYFQQKFKKKRKEVIKFRIYAVTWIVVGIIVTLLATITNIALQDRLGEYYKIIGDIISPATWFVIWSGLDLLFFKSSDQEFLKDLKFFRKMRNIKICFKGFEYEGSGFEEMNK